MAKDFFVKVYEVNLKFCYLHILIVFFPCGFKHFYGIHWPRKEGATHFKMIVEKEKYIIMYFNFSIIMSKVWKNQN
jgi:hypothetical protein